MAKQFDFKQFSVRQDRCAMKIGTDGVLLGAWTSLAHEPGTILDVGTGTGVIALMLAQRSPAGTIDALELEDKAFEQAVENFENSSWSDRLFCYHAAFDEFTTEMQTEEKYDLIVSNPPFYSEDYISRDPQREQARFRVSLPFEELVQGVSALLSPHGRFSVIIPRKTEAEFLDLSRENGLYPLRITRVKGTVSAEEKRSLLELGFKKDKTVQQSLIIENSRHDYTQQYQDLVREFYLRM